MNYSFAPDSKAPGGAASGDVEGVLVSSNVVCSEGAISLRGNKDMRSCRRLGGPMGFAFASEEHSQLE